MRMSPEGQVLTGTWYHAIPAQPQTREMQKTGKAVFLGLNMECVTAVKAALDLVILAVA